MKFKTGNKNAGDNARLQRTKQLDNCNPIIVIIIIKENKTEIAP